MEGVFVGMIIIFASFLAGYYSVPFKKWWKDRS